jgi:type IV pilus assembly protein PilE
MFRNQTLSTRAASRGFTLIETMIAVAVAGVLSGVAYPSFQGQVQKARRADAIVTVMQVQLAQERFRGNAASYGTLAELGVAATSPSGHYQLQTSAVAADGYDLLATATGTQARDAHCRYLMLHAANLGFTYASGPDATVANPPDANRRCWSL